MSISNKCLRKDLQLNCCVSIAWANGQSQRQGGYNNLQQTSVLTVQWLQLIFIYLGLLVAIVFSHARGQ